MHVVSSNVPYVSTWLLATTNLGNDIFGSLNDVPFVPHMVCHAQMLRAAGSMGC